MLLHAGQGVYKHCVYGCSHGVFTAGVGMRHMVPPDNDNLATIADMYLREADMTRMEGPSKDATKVLKP
jgi:hypothetical protein